MLDTLPRLILDPDGAESADAAPMPSAAVSDAALLDAYSEAVARIADHHAPSLAQTPTQFVPPT